MEVSEAQRFARLDDENRWLAGLRQDVAFVKEQFSVSERLPASSLPWIEARTAMNPGPGRNRRAAVSACLDRDRDGNDLAGGLVTGRALHVSSNQEWALDFVADTTGTWCGIRVLTFVDAFTRECWVWRSTAA